MMHKCMRQRSHNNNNNNSITRFHHNLPVIWPSRFPALTWIHPWLKFPAREPWLVWSDGRDGSVWCENLLGAKDIPNPSLPSIIYIIYTLSCLLIFLFDIHLHNTVHYCTHASFRKKNYEVVRRSRWSPKSDWACSQTRELAVSTTNWCFCHPVKPHYWNVKQLFPKKTKPETDFCLTTSGAFCLRNSWYYPEKMQMLVIKPGHFFVPG